MSEQKILERDELALPEVESPHFVPASPHRSSIRQIKARCFSPLPWAAATSI